MGVNVDEGNVWLRLPGSHLGSPLFSYLFSLRVPPLLLSAALFQLLVPPPLLALLLLPHLTLPTLLLQAEKERKKYDFDVFVRESSQSGTSLNTQGLCTIIYNELKLVDLFLKIKNNSNLFP